MLSPPEYHKMSAECLVLNTVKGKMRTECLLLHTVTKKILGQNIYCFTLSLEKEISVFHSGPGK